MTRYIDADALIRDIDKSADLGGALGKVVECVKIYAKFMVQTAPTIEPQRWIPVSERLPDDLSEVNVTWVNHNPESYYKFIKDVPLTATAVYYKRKWYWYSSTCADILSEYGRNDFNEVDKDVEITAWMPLPEPYKREQE